MIYLFSAQRNEHTWHYLYTKEMNYMFLFSDTDKNNPLSVKCWTHRNNMTTETNWNPLWLDFIPSILNIVDVFQMNTDELHQRIDDTITLRILESI